MANSLWDYFHSTFYESESLSLVWMHDHGFNPENWMFLINCPITEFLACISSTEEGCIMEPVMVSFWSKLVDV